MGVRWNESEDIDVLGTSYLSGLYSSGGWKFFNPIPDRGIDHKIEFFEGNILSGISVYVQLKSHERVERLGKRKEFSSNKLECEHLEYYLKMRQPVFLVVVDITEKIGYWVFLQKHADTVLRDSDWRLRLELARATGNKEKPEVQIRLPVANLISDRKSFKQAMVDANGYMARRGVAHGLRYAREEYELLDPRIKIRATATETGVNYSLLPQTGLQLRWSFSQEFVETGKWESLIGRGHPVSITPGSVQVEGSLLFQALLEEAASNRGKMSLTLKGSGFMVLSRTDSDGREVARLDSMECGYEGGSIECRFEATLLNGLIRVKSSYEAGNLGPVNANIKYSFRPWIGSPVLDLPHFDSLYNVFGAVRSKDGFRMRLMAGGNQVAAATMNITPGQIASYSDVLRTIFESRWIARRFDVNPAFRAYTEYEVNEIAALYALLNGQEISQPYDKTTVTGVVPRAHSGLFTSDLAGPDEEFRAIGPIEAVFDYLGEKLKVDGLERHLSNLQLETKPEDVRRQFDEGAEEVPIILVSTEKSRLIYKLAANTNKPAGSE